MKQLPYTIEMDIARIKERLRTKNLNKSSAILSIVLLSSLKNWWISGKEIAETLKELGYDINYNLVNTVMYKEKKKGLIKSKRLGKSNAYKANLKDIGMITKRILHDEIRNYVITDLTEEILGKKY